MKKKNLIKVITLVLVFTMMAVPMSVFAEELEVTTERASRQARPERDRTESSEKRLELVLEYAEDSYDDWLLLFAEHANLKLQFEELKTQLEGNKEVRKERNTEGKAFLEGIRNQVKNEEITREEAKVLMEERKASRVSSMEDRKDEIDLLKAEKTEEREYFKGLLETKRDLNLQIKEGIESGDTSNVGSLLNSIYDINLELKSMLEEKIQNMQLRLSDKEVI